MKAKVKNILDWIFIICGLILVGVIVIAPIYLSILCFSEHYILLGILSIVISIFIDLSICGDLFNQ